MYVSRRLFLQIKDTKKQLFKTYKRDATLMAHNATVLFSQPMAYRFAQRTHTVPGTEARLTLVGASRKSFLTAAGARTHLTR